MESFRIPKHVDERDSILGLYKLEWLYMAPFIALAYLIAILVYVVVLKAILIIIFIGVPWHFMSQRSMSGRRNAILVAHRFRASRRQHVFRRACGTVIMILGDERDDVRPRLHFDIRHACGEIHGKVRILIQMLRKLMEIRFHAAQVRAHHAQVRVRFQHAIARYQN